MALQKNTRRIAQATAATLAGMATLVGGRVAYKKLALPAAESNEGETAPAEEASPKRKSPKAAIPKPRLPKIDLPTPALPKVELPKPAVPKVEFPKIPKRTGLKPTVRDAFTPEGDPIRILEVGKAFQSVTYTEPEHRFDLALEYYRAFNLLFDLGPTITSVLALGAGGCAWPKHASHDHPDVRIDAVEADPQIASIAHEKFFIDELPGECQFQLHQSDALDFLLKCQEEGTRYSAIVNDCFEGKNADEGLLSIESLGLAKKCLDEGGLYLLNVTSMRKGKSLRNVKRATKALNKAFKHVYVFPCTDTDMGGEDNYVLIATDGKYKIER